MASAVVLSIVAVVVIIGPHVSTTPENAATRPNPPKGRKYRMKHQDPITKLTGCGYTPVAISTLI